MLTRRFATEDDCRELAELNHQLIRDEGHRNRLTAPELEQRMRGWLASGEYQALLFAQNGTVVAYALYSERPDHVYLRQFFVVRDHRRNGIGRSAMEILRTSIWPRDKRLVVEVPSQNDVGIAFWRTMGFRDYALTLEIMPPKVESAPPLANW